MLESIDLKPGENQDLNNSIISESMTAESGLELGMNKSVLFVPT